MTIRSNSGRRFNKSHHDMYSPSTQIRTEEMSLSDIERLKEELDIKEQLAIGKSLNSDNPNEILKAMQRIDSSKGIGMTDSFTTTSDGNVYGGKSLLQDPYGAQSVGGYLQKLRPVDNRVLRNMARSPFVKAIVETRVEQVATFATPTEDKDTPGWRIVRRDREEVDDSDKANIEKIIRFVLDTGEDENRWVKDDFDKFLRKLTNDSLTLDAATFEVVRTKNDRLFEFFATDAATFYFADQREMREKTDEINGYHPMYVQVFQGQVMNYYYPWELSFGIRNPISDIYQNGYGRSELEDLINIVTWQLYGMQYTGAFFSKGSAPKGILKIQGNINERRLAEFKQQWQAQVQGVKNAWKTPILESDKVDWVDLQKNNRDMEFSNWIEFLTKILCGIYKIDPSEIGMPMSGSQSSGGSMFGDETKERQLFSKEKGLKPLLKFLEQKIDKYIVQQLDERYEFQFTGVSFSDPAKELEADIKRVGSFMGYKEIRRKNNLPDDIDGDDMILNQILWQKESQKMMGGSEGDQYNYDEEEIDDTSNPFLKSMGDATNSLIKSINDAK